MAPTGKEKFNAVRSSFAIHRWQPGPKRKTDHAGVLTHPSESWVDEKLKNPKLRKGFLEEFEKLSIGEQLVRLRLQAGLTQVQVAKRVGTTASAISRYENAEYDRYEIQTLRKIVEACGGQLKVMMEGPDDKGRVA